MATTADDLALANSKQKDIDSISQAIAKFDAPATDFKTFCIQVLALAELSFDDTRVNTFVTNAIGNLYKSFTNKSAALTNLSATDLNTLKTTIQGELDNLFADDDSSEA